MGRFSDKRILITGGTSGMGLAGARRVIAEGGTVLLTGLNEQRLEAAKQEFHDKAVVLRNDAAAPDAVELAESVASVGPLDGLWLNAAFASLGSPETLFPSEFDRMMATNVRGPMLQIGALSPHLAAGASVVVTSCSSTYEGGAATGLYPATKGAVIAMA